MTGLLAAALLVSGPAWDLKAPLAKDTKVTLPMHVEVVVGGQDHTADFKFNTAVIDRTDDGAKVRVTWTDTTVDGNTQEDLPAWEFKSGLRGQILKPEGDLSEDYARMLAPMSFIYPEKPVSVGDKWDLKVGKLDYSFTAKAEEKWNNVDALKVESKLTETGDGLKADGTWWLDATGKVLRYEVKVKNWVLPFSGDGEPLTATIKGG